MNYVWSTWLADALRADPWLAPRVIERSGWQSFGRPPSQFSYNPSGLIDHHTACCMPANHDPQACINGIVAGNSSAPGPIAQLLGTWTPPGTRWNGTNPDPYVVVIAAGRSNHAGDGAYPWGAPSGNGSAIGIEWCGPPPGPWPDIIIEARERVTAALLAHCGWTTRQLTTHNEYVAPVRPGDKIDPSGAYPGEPGLAQMSPWNASTWRTRVDARLSATPQPEPEPTPEEDEMARWLVIHPLTGEWFVSDMATYKTYVDSPGVGSEGMTLFGWSSFDGANPIGLGPGWANFLDQLPATCP